MVRVELEVIWKMKGELQCAWQGAARAMGRMYEMEVYVCVCEGMWETACMYVCGRPAMCRKAERAAKSGNAGAVQMQWRVCV